MGPLLLAIQDAADDDDFTIDGTRVLIVLAIVVLILAIFYFARRA
jgi:hypothetical protein